MTRPRFSFRDERGVILPLTLMILVVLAAMVSALLALGVSEPQIAANVVRGAQALGVAEAGAERAIAFFRANQATVNNADCLLACPGAVTDLWTNETLTEFGADGKYTVRWRAISYATVQVESTGRVTAGSTTVTRVVRVVLSKQFVNKFGVLGEAVEITGNSAIMGNVASVQGNTSTKLDNNALVQQAATTAGATCERCTTTGSPAGTACNCAATAVVDLSPGARGVGLPGASGTGAPEQALPSLSPSSFLEKATVILGGGSPAPAIPGKCTSVAVFSGGNFTGSYSGTTVPEHWVLDASSRVCEIYPNQSNPATSSLGPGNYTASGSTPGTNPFSSFQMHGGGEWQIAGGSPPDGAYYATKEIKVTGNVGSSATPWAATLVAGSTSEDGRVEIDGTVQIKAYSSSVVGNPLYKNEFLTIAGEVKLKGNVGAAGVVVGTALGDSATGGGLLIGTPTPGDGRVEITGNVTLTGNVVSNGRAKIEGGAKVIYNSLKRTRILSNKLVILSWTASSTIE